MHSQPSQLSIAPLVILPTPATSANGSPPPLPSQPAIETLYQTLKTLAPLAIAVILSTGRTKM
jgi:hypothetical protein